jgi:hypothetical protein
MPYEEHPKTQTLPDEVIVWRYMDFVKFVDLLERSSLWFTRADKLLNDPREGDLTEMELSQFREAPSPEVAEHNLGVFRSLRRENFLNCWNERVESMAMWDLYAHAPGGVAIKSTIGRIKQAIENATEKIFISRVEYIDWNTATFPNNIIAMYVRKAFGFAHESEVRMIIWDANSSIPTPAEAGDVVQLHNSLLPFLPQLSSQQREVLKRILREEWDRASVRRAKLWIRLPIDLTSLIDEVIISPRSATHQDLARRILQRYDLQEKPVRRSELSYPRDNASD